MSTILAVPAAPKHPSLSVWRARLLQAWRRKVAHERRPLPVPQPSPASGTGALLDVDGAAPARAPRWAVPAMTQVEALDDDQVLVSYEGRVRVTTTQVGDELRVSPVVTDLYSLAVGGSPVRSVFVGYGYDLLTPSAARQLGAALLAAALRAESSGGAR